MKLSHSPKDRYAGTYIHTFIYIYIKVKRLEWAAHLIHDSEKRMIKKVVNTKAEGTWKVGKPILRLEVYVWQDIRILGVTNWRSVALNGEEWRVILRKARAYTGLSC
jgi:hypothetical protein